MSRDMEGKCLSDIGNADALDMVIAVSNKVSWLL